MIVSGERNWKARERDEIFFYHNFFLSSENDTTQMYYLLFLMDKIIPQEKKDTAPGIVLELKESSSNILNLIKVSEASSNQLC